MLLFSDHKRWVKIGLSFIVIMVSGIYYNSNRSKGYAGRDSAALSTEVNSPEHGNLCLQQVKIEREGNLFFAVTRKNKYTLLNLPEIVKKNVSGDYAIRGRIVKGNYLIVESIRRKHSRFLKLTVSCITATIICPLFFVFFRLTPTGFSPKNTP